MHTIELKRHSFYILIGICLFSLAAVAFELRRAQAGGIEIIAQEATQANHSGSYPAGPLPADSSPEQDFVPVYLVGAVEDPGIYLVARGSYLYELVERAGGLSEDAAGDVINLALAITENCHIRIPTRAEVAGDPATSDILVTAQASGVQKININQASLEELDQLPGIGPATAKAILDYRERNGPFKSKEDLMKVSGIKQSRLDAISDLITLA
ncbi:MAG: ComEA family DNA-binding protein [Clostridia bacterium]|nr:ComEA family DNA-binding protein [Clostridia bacterium]